MHIDTFKIFCDLVESGSFSKAGALNSITQSAVSQQIRAIEERFKVRLVERGQRHFALTPEGSVFLQAGREILGVFNDLDRRLHALRNVVAGELRIASIYSIGLHELPPFLQAFRQRYPDVELHVEYRRSPQVYEQVAGGEVDLGLVAYPVKRSGLQTEIFSEDRMVLICHPQHALAHRPKIRLAELNGEKFIGFEPDQPTRKVIDRHLRAHAVQIEHAMEFDNIETVKRAVEIGAGVSIVPAGTVAQEVSKSTLVAMPFVDIELDRPIGLIHKKSKVLSPAMKQFIASLQVIQPIS